nr:PorT family protein [Saprospiraceae bacterium]
MEKLFTFTLLVLLASFLSIGTLDSQVNIGIRAGLSTTQLDPKELLIVDQDGVETFKLRVKEVNYGFHIGLLVRFQINKFYIQPEFLYNSHSVDYEFDEIANPELENFILSERFQHLDIPLMLGLKFGFFRINAGPVGHFQLSSVSDLTDKEGYSQKFEEMTFGYQGGIGFDIWNIHLDFRYEGNLTQYGEHIEFFGRQYDFSDTPSRLIASIGFVF